jgi:PAS domain S-box-containing protein
VLLSVLAWGADRQRRRVLSESERRFRSMADAAPMPFRVLDARLRCTYVNPAYLAVAHGVPEDQLGDGWREALHPDDRGQAEAELRSAAEQGGSYEMEYRLRRPDGAYAWILERGEPRLDEGGRWEGCVGILIDITERRDVGAALEAAVWAAGIGLWSWDVDTGKVAYAPEYKAQLGLRPDEMQDTFDAWRGRVHPDDLPPATTAIQAALTSNLRRFEARFRLRHKDGSWRHILSRALVERDRDGKPVRMLGGHLDVTEFHDAQEDLRRHRDHLERLVAERTADLLEAKNAAEHANVAKSEFLANMSHEMRTPMHAILSFTGIARRKFGRPDAEPEALLGYLTRIDDSGRRLLRLLNDLLDLSRLEAGMMQYDFEAHPAASIVLAVVAELEPMAQDKGVRLVTAAIDRDLLAHCDAARMEQVLRNLIANAIRFTPAGKEVRVDATGSGFAPPPGDADRPARRAVCFVVSDDGVGIPESERESVFDKFVQSSRTKTGAGGTGLGLAIVRQIVAHHGGQIVLRASGSGGAEFVVRIPAVEATPTLPPPDPRSLALASVA